MIFKRTASFLCHLPIEGLYTFVLNIHLLLPLIHEHKHIFYFGFTFNF